MREVKKLLFLLVLIFTISLFSLSFISAATCVNDQLIMRISAEGEGHLWSDPSQTRGYDICYDDIFGQTYNKATGEDVHACKYDQATLSTFTNLLLSIDNNGLGYPGFVGGSRTFDTDGNNIIDGADVGNVIYCSQFNGENCNAADNNDDGVVNAVDVQRIINCALGIGLCQLKQFPSVSITTYPTLNIYDVNDDTFVNEADYKQIVGCVLNGDLCNWVGDHYKEDTNRDGNLDANDIQLITTDTLTISRTVDAICYGDLACNVRDSGSCLQTEKEITSLNGLTGSLFFQRTGSVKICCSSAKTPPGGNGCLDPNKECTRSSTTYTCPADKGVGTYSCGGDCKWDYSGCKPVSRTCPNGEIDPVTEDCEGTNFGTKTYCTDYGYTSGTLACTKECKIDLSRCVNNPCGNPIGTINPPEECDGTNFGGLNCGSFPGYEIGNNLICDSNCKINLGACVKKTVGVCQDGIINTAQEKCDKTDLGGQTCRKLGYADEGTGLKCDGNCQFDKSGCGCPGTLPQYNFLTGQCQAINSKTNNMYFNGLDKCFIPTMGYYHPLGGGYVSLWNTNGTNIVGNNGVWTQTNKNDFVWTNGQPVSQEVKDFKPVVGYYHALGGEWISLWNSTGGVFVLNNMFTGAAFSKVDKNSWIMSDGLPADNYVKNFNATVGYYHPFGGGYVSLWDIKGFNYGLNANWWMAINKNNWKMVGGGDLTPEALAFKPIVGYYHPFGGGYISLWDVNGVNYVVNSLGVAKANKDDWRYNGGVPADSELKNFKPTIGYMDYVLYKVVLWNASGAGFTVNSAGFERINRAQCNAYQEDIIIDTSQTMCGTYNAKRVLITNNAVVTICQWNGIEGTGTLQFNTENFTMMKGTKIIGTGKGFTGGNPSVNGWGTGHGYAWGGGGGYGGAGGFSGGAGGIIYGSDIDVTSIGSGGAGGGDTGNGYGGNGGGYFKVNALDRIIINGTIDVSGNSGTLDKNGAGGGSGGGIWVKGKYLYINNSINASGGVGGDASENEIDWYSGGGGGGGRILIDYCIDLTNLGTQNSIGGIDGSPAYAGADGGYGESGTVKIRSTCEGIIGYCNNNGICEAGENCDCADCNDVNDPCDNLVCDIDNTCQTQCTSPSRICNDGFCRENCEIINPISVSCSRFKTQSECVQDATEDILFSIESRINQDDSLIPAAYKNHFCFNKELTYQKITDSCGTYVKCGCIWDRDECKESTRRVAEPSGCISLSPNEEMLCVINVTGISNAQCTTGDEALLMWNVSWRGEQTADPRLSGCTAGQRTMPCQGKVRIDFFDWKNVIIAVIVIFISYLVIVYKTKKRVKK
ncbi:MAG: hypothetical protein WC781_05075 [Candidatus Pacearchaeota archaeon]|jgi:hypothetical protein